MANIEALLEEEDETSNQTPKSESKNEEPKTPSRDELIARLRNKTRAAKQNRSPKTTKLPSHPLTPIFYCESPNCLKIMTETDAKFCPVCRVNSYCSKECQVADWDHHKAICGSKADESGKARLELYKECLKATNAIIEKTKPGDYMTVINEEGDAPACMFATIARNSNVLHWSQYLKTPIFTTAPFHTLGNIGRKAQEAAMLYEGKKLYIIVTLLDRVRDNDNSEGVIRFFIADSFGEIMAVPKSGKVTQTVTKFKRKTK